MQRLASDHRYAKAAVALLPSLARELGLARIEAPIEPENLASQAAAQAGRRATKLSAGPGDPAGNET